MAQKSRILSEMHDTMKDMHELGFISDDEMLEADVLCFQGEVVSREIDRVAA